MPTAWSLLTLNDVDRQFAGNEGYPDVLGRSYVWDATVPNSRQVRKGDLAVLRDGNYVLGVGWIEDIETWVDSKLRFRCPTCGRTGFKERTTIRPRYRCSECKSTFDDPTVELLTDLDFFRAHYAESWSPLRESVAVPDIRALYRTNATQHAIRELDLPGLKQVIDRLAPSGGPW